MRKEIFKHALIPVVDPTDPWYAHARECHAGWWSPLCERADCPFTGYLDNNVYVGALTLCPRCQARAVHSASSAAREDDRVRYSTIKDCSLCGWFHVDITRPREAEAYALKQRYYGEQATEALRV